MTNQTSALYPRTTIDRDWMGHLRIWDYAPVTVDQVLSGTYPESTIYVQGEQDIESVLEMLTAEEREIVQMGFMIETTNIDDAIFGDQKRKEEDQRIARNQAMIDSMKR